MRTKKNVLIVGGSGFIGHHIILKIINLRYNVYCLSKNKIKNKIKNVIYIRQDLNNKNKLFKSINLIKFDYVIYSAGYIQHEVFDKKGFEYISYNIKNFNNLIESIDLKYVKKFINISSSDEYGISKAPQKESQYGIQLTPYSILKKYNSSLLKTLNLKYKLNYLNVFTFLVYGPGQNIDRLIPAMITNFLNDKLFVLKNPKFNRDLLYIEDYVDLIIKLLRSKKITNMNINIGSGKVINLTKLAKIIYSKIKRGNLNIPENNIITNSDVKDLYPNLKKLKTHIKDWKPKFNLDYGLNLTIEYYKKFK
tara:strand:- start:823 stop:1746 length:924 start_codon:yes stop_codon:yes gene_type:complete